MSPLKSFLQPFKSLVWLIILACVLLVGLALWLLDMKSPFSQFYAAADKNRSAGAHFISNAGRDDRL